MPGILGLDLLGWYLISQLIISPCNIFNLSSSLYVVIVTPVLSVFVFPNALIKGVSGDFWMTIGPSPKGIRISHKLPCNITTRI